jgi:hypothetical protein
VQGGSTSNKSTRLVASNLAPGGIESATARYDGWYVSPDIAYGIRLPVWAGVTLTPTARLRYLAGMFDGYGEVGSAQNLVVGNRTVQDVEERLELVLSRRDPLGHDGVIKTSATLGVLGLERLGDTTVNTVLIGQNLAFATPGKDAVAGVYSGLALDYRMTDRIGVFGAVEGTLMSDHSRTGTAKGGVRVAF